MSQKSNSLIRQLWLYLAVESMLHYADETASHIKQHFRCVPQFGVLLGLKTDKNMAAFVDY